MTDAGSAGTSLWLDPGFGASGDMLLGTMVGLGAPVDELRAGLASLAVDGWTIEEQVAYRCGLNATRVAVQAEEQHHHRTWRSIDDLLARSNLPQAVAAGARSTFRRLGEVEAAIHGVDIDDVHFHEVGAVDAIVDIVGTWLAADLLGLIEMSEGGDATASSIVCGPVGLGVGTVHAAHGMLPLPAPATADLLVGAPVKSLDHEGETVTPTGAALLTTLASDWGPMPAGTLLATARGAGGRDPATHPNVVTGHLIRTSGATADLHWSPAGDRSHHAAVVLATNLDDVPGEVVAHTITRCLQAGADDAWADPVVMKKGRPGVELRVLCRPDRASTMADLLFAETATLGLRVESVTKIVQARRFDTVTVRGHRIAIKVGPEGAKPEFDDLVEASVALSVPVRILAAEAMAVHLETNVERTDG